tara:strand:+ start:1369 stop:1605 length:237 start_codon:yes stop_codon:yes gene_type:complete
MAWATLLSGFLRLFNAIADVLRNKQLMDAGEDKARAKTLEKTNGDILDKTKINVSVGSMSDKQLRDELLKWGKSGSDN